MFKKPEKRYFAETRWSDGDIFLSNAKTCEQWERSGLGRDTRNCKVRYFEYDPSRLTEVDMNLMVSNQT